MFGDWNYTNKPILILVCHVSLNFHHHLILGSDFVTYFQHFKNRIQDTEQYICVYMYFLKNHTLLEILQENRKLNCLISHCFHMRIPPQVQIWYIKITNWRQSHICESDFEINHFSSNYLIVSLQSSSHSSSFSPNRPFGNTFWVYWKVMS